MNQKEKGIFMQLNKGGDLQWDLKRIRLKIEKRRLLNGALSYLKHRGSARRETL